MRGSDSGLPDTPPSRPRIARALLQKAFLPLSYLRTRAVPFNACMVHLSENNACIDHYLKIGACIVRKLGNLCALSAPAFARYFQSSP